MSACTIFRGNIPNCLRFLPSQSLVKVVGPAADLTDVLPRLARRIRIADVGAVVPARWKARRLAAAPTPGLARRDGGPVSQGATSGGGKMRLIMKGLG